MTHDQYFAKRLCTVFSCNPSKRRAYLLEIENGDYQYIGLLTIVRNYADDNEDRDRLSPSENRLVSIHVLITVNDDAILSLRLSSADRARGVYLNPLGNLT